MTKKQDHKPASAVIVLPDPDDNPVRYDCEEGDTLEIRSGAANYTDFHLEFVGANPFSKVALKGSTHNPLLIPIPAGSEGEYEVTVLHIHNKDQAKNRRGNIRFNVHPCRGCPPIGPGL
jgi:hypothetical protein